MDRFQAMTTFVTVVETGGFASAARKLDVSPSVVSRVVTELEERLGVRLLTRTTRVVRLTEPARPTSRTAAASSAKSMTPSFPPPARTRRRAAS